jgi:hypothetical protein
MGGKLGVRGGLCFLFLVFFTLVVGMERGSNGGLSSSSLYPDSFNDQFFS